jgi:hypothetical protein
MIPVVNLLDIGVDDVLRGIIFFEQIDDSVKEGCVVCRHLCVESDALFYRIFVVVLIDGHIATAHANHAILSASRDLFDFGT